MKKNIFIEYNLIHREDLIFIHSFTDSSIFRFALSSNDDVYSNCRKEERKKTRI